MNERMSADAIVVFHPKDPAKLAPFLDLDEDSEDSEGLYAEELDDGTMLVHTFQPFELFAQNPDELSAWLEQFGADLPEVHDDARGFLVYPDTCEPSATSYAELVAEIADDGFFAGVDHDGDDELDLGALGALAEQLLAGHGGDGAQVGSFDLGQMALTMQKHLADALGMPEEAPSPIVDDEFEADVPGKK